MSANILTKENVKRYFENHAVLCPYCESKRLSIQNTEYGDDMVWRDCGCNDCLETWREEYALVRIFNFSNPTGFEKKALNASDDFESWWYSTGSGLAPYDEEDTEEFAKRIALEAWNQSKESK